MEKFSGPLLAAAGLGAALLVLIGTYERRPRRLLGLSSVHRCYVPGIANVGNTCFLNVSLQLFASSKLFNRYLSACAERAEGDAEASAFIQQMREIITFLQSYSPIPVQIPIVPFKLLSMFGQTMNLHLMHQQDAHEFLMVANGRLTEDLERNDRTRRLGARLLQSLRAPQGDAGLPVMVTRGGFGLPPSDALPYNPFAGVLVSYLACTACHTATFTPAPFVVLDLFIPMRGPGIATTLNECLENFAAAEAIDDVTCPACTERRNARLGRGVAPSDSVRARAIKRLQLGRAPQLLCLHVNLAGFAFDGVFKHENALVFPTTLDLRPYMLFDGGHESMHSLDALRDSGAGVGGGPTISGLEAALGGVRGSTLTVSRSGVRILRSDIAANPPLTSEGPSEPSTGSPRAAVVVKTASVVSGTPTAPAVNSGLAAPPDETNSTLSASQKKRARQNAKKRAAKAAAAAATTPSAGATAPDTVPPSEASDVPPLMATAVPTESISAGVPSPPSFVPTTAGVASSGASDAATQAQPAAAASVDYDLIAVVVHHGNTAMGGHYTMFRRAPFSWVPEVTSAVDDTSATGTPPSTPRGAPGTPSAAGSGGSGMGDGSTPRRAYRRDPTPVWMAIDDRHVTVVPESTVLMAEPYLLLYERR